jgi:hypothetical protein
MADGEPALVLLKLEPEKLLQQIPAAAGVGVLLHLQRVALAGRGVEGL